MRVVIVGAEISPDFCPVSIEDVLYPKRPLDGEELKKIEAARRKMLRKVERARKHFGCTARTLSAKLDGTE